MLWESVVLIKNILLNIVGETTNYFLVVMACIYTYMIKVVNYQLIMAVGMQSTDYAISRHQPILFIYFTVLKSLCHSKNYPKKLCLNNFVFKQGELLCSRV